MVKKIMKRKYKARLGSIIDDKKAQIYGERLDKIRQAKGGFFKAEDVIEDAKSKSSPLHSFFEWKDTVAAAKYRLQQAQTLTGSIMEVKVISGVQSEQRSFWNVTRTNGKTQRVYVTLDEALSTPSYKKELLDKIIGHLENTTTLMRLFKNQ